MRTSHKPFKVASKQNDSHFSFSSPSGTVSLIIIIFGTFAVAHHKGKLVHDINMVHGIIVFLLSLCFSIPSFHSSAYRYKLVVITGSLRSVTPFLIFFLFNIDQEKRSVNRIWVQDSLFFSLRLTVRKLSLALSLLVIILSVEFLMYMSSL